jgi:hypothetical protein
MRLRPLAHLFLLALAATAVALPAGIAAAGGAPTATTTSTTAPSTATTTVATSASPPGSVADPHATSGSVPAYWLASSNGGVFTFGGAPFFGSAGNLNLTKPIVGMAATPDDGGYWLVASDGGIFSYGDAPFYGSTGNIRLNQPIVGMTPTPDGKGYWLVASDGGIFTFGDARFFGSTGNLRLNQPVVGMAATPDGGGYWLVASDGGIFTFGDAQFYGSTGNLKLNKPIISMMAGPGGTGYILVASDGGTFTFGTTNFYGSLGGIPLKHPVAAAAIAPGETGYWFSDTVGLVTAFGQASYYGSAPSALGGGSIVGMAEASGTGSFTGAAFPSGAFGHDVSKFNMNAACTTGLPTDAHDIGVVEVDGTSSGAPNPCLATEATWAGAGLNLYSFLTNIGQCTPTSPDTGSTTTTTGSSTTTTTTTPTVSCFTVGFNAGIHAFQDAQAAGVNTNVAWWFDVEGAGQNWTSSTASNAQTVMGAIAALHDTEGIATVGVYASPGTWNGIVGNYQPAVPYWMADWFSPPNGPESCAQVAPQRAAHLLPTGPVEFVQYSNNIQGADGDYAC